MSQTAAPAFPITAALAFAAAVGASVLLFLPAWQSMATIWWHNETYTHGMLHEECSVAAESSCLSFQRQNLRQTAPLQGGTCGHERLLRHFRCRLGLLGVLAQQLLAR